MMTFGWRLNLSCYDNTQAAVSTPPAIQTGTVGAPASAPVSCPSNLWFYALAAGAAIAGMMSRK
jgi:hypothetical protein